ncbi:MAG: hypothetical protein MZW92_27205 [Comamonadaceae bacterium]|nr:hypothetical protein [Comamonadaceae bacterium]
MNLSIEYEQEQDGRWLVEVPQRGVLVHGSTTRKSRAEDANPAPRVVRR